ncbi:MAG: TolC family protein [Gammaproteobacteria bacterium]|nr:TolC family protein [Gammaproteobacteria bacterium]
MKPKRNTILNYFSLVLAASTLSWPMLSNAEQVWTLQSTVQRVLEVAPEFQASQQIIGIRRSDQQQANLWPNPEIEIRADEKLGMTDGSGGYDVNQLVISQPIPVNRMKPQIKQAESLLSASQSQSRQQQLMLEYQAAMLFHELQLKMAQFDLRQQRLNLADQFQPSNKVTGKSRDRLVRYLSPMEQKRLAIMRESARQAMASAEGELNETIGQFRILANLEPNTVLKLSPLELLVTRPVLESLQKQLVDHPGLLSARHTIAAAQAETELAKASRYKDPTVNLFIERDNFNSQNESYAGISVNMEIPLWNENSRAVSLAQAGLIRSRADFEVKQRELNSQLQQSFVHYEHLLQQAGDYKDHLLKPAEEMFYLSRKSFAAGEQNILGLIDSNNAYFDIKNGYLKLLAEAGQELAMLRLAAGVFVTGVAGTEQGDAK